MHKPQVHSPSPPVGLAIGFGAEGAPKLKPADGGAAVGLKPPAVGAPKENPPLGGAAAGVNPVDEGADDDGVEGFRKVNPPLGGAGGPGEEADGRKLNPPVGTDGIATGAAAGLAEICAPGFDASQMVHFSVAVAGFFNMQVSHSHSPAAAAG